MEEKEFFKKVDSFLQEKKDREIFKEIEHFHKKRIEKLKKNETPVSFISERGKIILHFIPFESYLFPKHYDLSVYKDQGLVLKPMFTTGHQQIYNFDGLLRCQIRSDRKSLSYVQLYTTGIIEAVEGYSLDPEVPLISIFRVEKEICDKTKEYLEIQKQLGVKPPIIFYLTLLGTKKHLIEYGTRDSYNRLFEGIRYIDREDLYLPKIIMKKFDIIPEKELKTTFDRIWNASGHSRSLDYDDKGEFKAK